MTRICLQELYESVEQHRPDHEKLNQVVKELLKVGRSLDMNEDIKVLEKEIDSTNERWINLQRDISEKLHATDQVEHEMADFKECVNTLHLGIHELIDSVRDVAVLNVPEGDEVIVKDIHVVPRICRPEEANKDVDTLQVCRLDCCKITYNDLFDLFDVE
jgi:uncharacterized protein YoxC